MAAGDDDIFAIGATGGIKPSGINPFTTSATTFAGGGAQLVNNTTGQVLGSGGFFDRIVRSGGSPQSQATAAIQRGLEQAGESIEQGTETARADLQPFTQAGLQGLAAVAPLINDPNAQAQFIQDNPFFDALAQDAQRRIFNQAGASGRGFAGGTAQALQNSIMLLGNDLLNSQVSRGMGLVDQGRAAATGQAGITSQGAFTLADLAARGGETEAAGILGLENTRRADKADSRSSRNDLIGLGLSAFGLSDRRFKTDINFIGFDRVPWYTFRYKGGDQVYVGTMADEVEHIPGAVIEVDGVKFVNYGIL